MAIGAKPMGKSPEAFRTISEVAAQLETPAHVLRFWESKFPQVKPVKRAGGRRYYRPDDIALLGGIKVLLHEKGMTIKGVQNLLRERGSRHVATLSALPWEGIEVVEDTTDEDAVERVIVGPWAGAATEDEPPQPDEPELQAGDDGPEGLRPDETGALRTDALADTEWPAEAALVSSLPGLEIQHLREVMVRCDRDRLRAQAERIAPLVARLKALRDAAAERSA